MLKNILENQLARRTIWVNYAFLFLIFLFNFLGHPAVKFAYLGYTCFALTAVLLFDLHVSFCVIFTIAFLEGQGRIVWDYHPFFRLTFDLVVALAILRTFLLSRKFKTSELLPLPILILIFFHFFWYAVEIFNPNSISIFSSIAAAKLYIFPFFIFLMLRQNQDSLYPERLKEIFTLTIVILVLECLLSLYQVVNLEKLLLAISPFYERAMKGTVFTLDKFRPFGTAFLPGGVASYLYLSTGFLFLRKNLSKKYLACLVPLIGLILLVAFICQVRSAMIKIVLIILGSAFSILITSRKKKSQLIPIFLLSLLLIPTLGFLFIKGVSDTEALNLKSGLDRWEFNSYKDIKARRVGPLEALAVATTQLEQFPIGLGPGSTGAATSLMKDEIKSDPIYDEETFWGYDNLYLSLIIDMGYGSIFYILILFSLPIALFSKARILLARHDFERMRFILICLVNIGVIIIGNWGVIGLTYNPESFFFWMWVALGFNIYQTPPEKIA